MQSRTQIEVKLTGMAFWVPIPLSMKIIKDGLYLVTLDTNGIEVLMILVFMFDTGKR